MENYHKAGNQITLWKLRNHRSETVGKRICCRAPNNEKFSPPNEIGPSAAKAQMPESHIIWGKPDY